MDMTNDLFESEIATSNDPDYETEGCSIFKEPQMEFLNNVDYSLNSPLIIDELDSFIKYIQVNKIESRWDEKIWSKRRRDLLPYIQKPLLQPCSNFYHWFGRINLSQVNSSEFKLFLKVVNEDSKETFEVVKSFFRGWLKKIVDYKNKDMIDEGTLKWGSLFFDLHKVTIFLNAESIIEIRNICDNMEECELDKYNVKKYTSKIFGVIILSHGFIYFVRHHRIIDRNTLLMMKDCYVARFQTCFALQNRHDNRYDALSLNRIQLLYKYGDIVFSKIGEISFKMIKILEPSCNLQLTHLAHKYRPLIPDFPNFEQHVLKAQKEMIALTPSCNQFFQLIKNTQSVYDILLFYSSFRHWGHPYIDYQKGLIKLHTQVTMKKMIDREYVESLASDLAFKVLQRKFQETKTWYVDSSLMENTHQLYPFIKENIWPTPDVIANFGDNWHLLPLIKCFEVPDVIDPTLIYSDKSHSMTKKEVKQYMLRNPNKAIPSKKVLKTLLEKEATNWPVFLQEINDVGLNDDDLIIGLKAKEREIKPEGRFFSLMSWRLRDYFVFTEYLIKTYYVPLFYELTMADDLTTVMRKMMENSSGQGLSHYDDITIANHIDYEKWNNHQRKESNAPIFKVMGQFLGYPNLFVRTHEFFESSLIYYNMRGDLMTIKNNQIVNRTSTLVCWNGQAGGLEGLRQKGWSVVNLLVVNRESQYRNTFVKCLIQGDNQVICTQYHLRKTRNQEELIENLKYVVLNNNHILENIERGTTKLGLIINKDETMQSADYLNYGKVPVFRGNILGLETKRWSRVTCVTNDQLPTMANVMATVTSNALTVSHFSTSPINPICHLNFLGNFVRRLIELHNPALRNSMSKSLINHTLDSKNYKIGVLYLDPSLGGICGCSLTRFLMRLFPDPITEGLSFFKIVHDHTSDNEIKNLMISFGNPKLVEYRDHHLSKLIEDPLSLNIPKGISSTTMLKNEIKKNLILNVGSIQNHIIKDVTKNYEIESAKLLSFLGSIRPRFPRFLSEFKAATYLGLTDSLISLFQNSKTIRNLFSFRLRKELDHIIVRSEIIGLSSLFNHSSKQNHLKRMWICSSHKADQLRMSSWATPILGATVPHPIELLNKFNLINPDCQFCTETFPSNLYVSTLIPSGMDIDNFRKGPYPAYLGSKTSETTSILQPWERETKIPLIQRASRLRSAIGWFIDPGSHLAQSIYDNLKSLTGEDWSNSVEGFKRTGSALHRFSCSRQSAGGFIAESPIKSTYMISTTNTLSELGSKNYDFIFQTLLLYTEITCGELHENNLNNGYYHFHLSCTKCLREIDEPILNTVTSANYRDVHLILDKWKPSNAAWSVEKKLHKLKEGNWNKLSVEAKSYHIGRGEGFLFGELTLTHSKHADDSSIFPLSLVGKICPQNYSMGLVSGLLHAGILNTIYRRSIISARRLKETGVGTVIYLIDRLSKNPNIINIWRNNSFESLFTTIPHKIPTSYPTSNTDFGTLGRNYLKHCYLKMNFMSLQFNNSRSELWIFSDLNQVQVVSLMLIASKLISILGWGVFSKHNLDQVKELRGIISNVRINNFNLTDTMKIDINQAKLVSSEIRHACRDMRTPDHFLTQPVNSSLQSEWKTELIVKAYVRPVFYQAIPDNQYVFYGVPQIQDPLISGLRQFQFATGSHYKIRGILSELKLNPNDVLIGGDGSGGISSCILRMYPLSRIIFNSLLDFSDVQLRGSNPSPPSAILGLMSEQHRCVNLMNVWKFPSDLSQSITWDYFKREIESHKLNIDLLIFDMEVTDLKTSKMIEENIRKYIFKISNGQVTLIYKTYLNYLLNPNLSCLNIFGPLFETIDVSYTEVTSSHSSEIYVICRGKKKSQFQNKYPLYGILRTHLSSHPGFQTKREEFLRAIQLKRYDFLQGIPRRFISDIYLDLATSLTSLGVFTGLSYEMSKFIVKHKSDTVTEGVYIFIISLNSILSITEGSKVSRNIPSDTIIQNIGILIVGFLNWYSYVREDFQLKLSVQKCIDHHFPFYWENSTQFHSYTHAWSPVKPYKSLKRIYLDNKLAAIGQVIRIFSRIFPSSLNPPDLKKLDKYLLKHNKNLTLKLFNNTTEIFSKIHELNKITEKHIYSHEVSISDRMYSHPWQM
ncbi:RNA-dependent RNA polymerase [jopcycgri virus 1]|uniref:Replicase n=1 Tax=jopcycgri virus 1 TaxID=2992924 RepID=A0A9E8AFE3_9RHAB|nr:RNA-dependent RNA polymerase [jopcycgri virus 1]